MKKFNKHKHGYRGYDTAINGVAKYQQDNYPSLIVTNDAHKYMSLLGTLMKHFLEINNIDYRKGKTYSAIDYNANLVQENWEKFKEYLKTKYLQNGS